MTSIPVKDALMRLDRLLDEERDALLIGKIDLVAEHSKAKEDLIDRLNRENPNNLPDLEPLQAKMSRNQILLDGALSGIRRVAMRLAAYRRIRETFDTYDARGKRQSIPTEGTGKVEKRA